VSTSLALIDVSECEAAPLVREPLSAQTAVDLAAQLKAPPDPVRLRLLTSLLSRSALERGLHGSRTVRMDLVRFLTQSRTRGVASNGSISR
jgi:hypothetical protein